MIPSRALPEMMLFDSSDTVMTPVQNSSPSNVLARAAMPVGSVPMKLFWIETPVVPFEKTTPCPVLAPITLPSVPAGPPSVVFVVASTIIARASIPFVAPAAEPSGARPI